MSKSKYTPRSRIKKTGALPSVPALPSAPVSTPVSASASARAGAGVEAPAGMGARAAWSRWLPAALIVAAVVAVYANSMRGPFVFDDVPAIVQNGSIRTLWSPGIFNPPGGQGETVGGRPLLNASFAVNYAISGLNTWSYHAVNVAIHALAALVLFGLVRRTVRVSRNGATAQRANVATQQMDAAMQQASANADAADANATTWFALAVTLVWALHPLCTGAVSYVVQRAESLCGLFYLLAVYCFSRAVLPGSAGISSRGFGNLHAIVAGKDARAPRDAPKDAPRSTRWLAAAVVACFTGVSVKEVAVTIPVIVFLYDRTFVAGSFRGAWRARRGWYLALMASWILVVLLMFSQGGRGMSAGYAAGMSWREYALTQCWAVTRYLRLAFWPAGQLFDYGILLTRDVAGVWPRALALACLLCATAWALARRPSLGFLGAWFFVILAPTSSVVPVVTQTVAEHRMYLPLIAVVALVLGMARKHAARFLPAAAVAVVVLLGAATVARNATYRGEESVWRDVAEKNPSSARAWANLGVALQRDGRLAAASECYGRAISLNPNHAFARGNLGGILVHEGKMAEAIPHLRIATRLEPDAPDMRFDLGVALAAEGKAKAMAGRMAEAEMFLREAVQMQPGNVEAHGNLGNVLLMQERAADAIREYEEVLHLKPDDKSVRENMELAREFLKLQRR
jgi:Flp pilus assembly protein TadD